MKNLTYLLTVSLLALTAVLFSSCQPEEPEGPETIEATGIVITPQSKTITIGETITFEIKVTPENATDKNWVLTVDNKDVATLDGNVLTAVGEGTAIVKATLGTLTATAAIIVEEPVVLATALKLTLSASEVEIGEKVTATVVVEPENATDKDYFITVDNTAIATVSGNEITTLAEGTVTVTAKLGELRESAVLTVKPPYVATTGIKISPKEKELSVGYNLGFTVTILPENATDKSYELTLDNQDLASLDGNALTAIATGTVKVTARQGEFTDVATITIVEEDEDIETIECLSCDFSDWGYASMSLYITSGKHNIYIVYEGYEEIEGTISFSKGDSSYAYYEGVNYTPVYATEFTSTIINNGDTYSFEAVITYETGEQYKYTYNGKFI